MTTLKDVEEMNIVDLNRHSVKVCRHCDKWKTAECGRVNVAEVPLRRVDWSSFSPCSEYAPNEIAKYALELLTIAKLEGKTIKRRTKIKEYFKPNKYGEQ